MSLRTLHSSHVRHKVVLVRADLNVSLRDGQILDQTRIEKFLPTLRFLINHEAKVVLITHLGRPKGKPVPELKLAPIALCLSKLLGGKEVPVVPLEKASAPIASMKLGDVLLLENIRFYPGEEANDAVFAQQLASLGDIFVNDAFSVSHRAHASVEAVTHFIPSYAGEQLVEEVETLSKVLTNPQHPVIALVGGAKVSTKIELLKTLSQTVDTLIIAGGLAHTFIAAQGYGVGKDSLNDPSMTPLARSILESSKAEIILPEDVRTASAVEYGQATRNVPIAAIDSQQIIVDMGDKTIVRVDTLLETARTLIWNGAVGIFEIPPFDQGTLHLARHIAGLTKKGQLFSVAGGGETIAALNKAGVMESLSYVSTGGGAFLEFLEGRNLPGIVALEKA